MTPAVGVDAVSTPTKTDRLVAESERLRLMLSGMAADLQTFSDALTDEVRALREEDDSDHTGE